MANMSSVAFDMARMIVDMIKAEMAARDIENSDMWLDATVSSVSTDGRFADLYIYGASTASPSIPIAPHVGTLAVGDEVVVLKRFGVDKIVMFKKVL